MVSIFKIESWMTMPAITMTPVIDKMSMDIPSNPNTNKTQNTTSTISDKMQVFHPCRRASFRKKSTSSRFSFGIGYSRIVRFFQ